MKMLTDFFTFCVLLLVINGAIGHLGHDFNFWMTVCVAQVTAVGLFLCFHLLSGGGMMRPKDQRVLDDLTVKESFVEIDCGDTLVKGVYHGLYRNQDGKWSLLIQECPKSKPIPVFTEHIVKFNKVVK